MDGSPQDNEQHGEAPEPRLTLVANVRRMNFFGESGEVRLGTKNFAPGARVIYLHWRQGYGHPKVHVIGRHRVSKRFIGLVMWRHHLEDWRTKVIYSPAELRLMQKHRRHAGALASDERAIEQIKRQADQYNNEHLIVAHRRPAADFADAHEALVRSGETVPEMLADDDFTGCVAYDKAPDHPVGLATRASDGATSFWVKPGLPSDDRDRARTLLARKLANEHVV